ncbi:Methanogenesis regulatory protein FilR1 [uncultured archaeon]|nr:Methanogenesis regulatory protein FilR1 [uncultured archaeon]
MKVYELFAELSSENRLAILQILDEKPMTFTSLIKEIDMNSAEAARQLSRLTESQLIEKKGDGRYYNTLFGKLVISSISDLNFISEKSGYFLNHDTAQIPLDLLGQIGALSTGEIVTGVYNILNTHEKLGDGIKSYMWYMSDDFPRHHLPYIEKKLEEGLEIRVILPEDKCSASLLSEKNRKKIETKVLDEIKISVIVSDSFSMLELPGPDGKIDQNTAIFGYDDRFREWCKKLFQYYWEAKCYPCY